MFPLSGALPLTASGANGDRPVSSHNGAYSTLLNPAPSAASGRNRFHNPRARASALSSSMTGGWKCGSPDAATCWRWTACAGSTRVVMNSASSRRRAWLRALGVRSIR